MCSKLNRDSIWKMGVDFMKRRECIMRRLSEEELKKVLEDHKVWLRTNKKDGKRADLNKVDLQYVDFLLPIGPI